jgi:hypothetical protein
MGLFRQAASLIAEKKPLSGLLKKSREIIARQHRELKKQGRAAIPLTWEDAGISPAPEDPGPRIEQKELERLLAVKGGDLTGDIKKIFREISHLPDGIEAPARLFSIFKENLHLEKAALLLYDPYRMVFAPWAASGYDKTTLRKLRLPLGFNRHFNRVAEGETLLISERAELLEFQRCFSAREFSGMDHLAFTPFIYEGKLLAALLVTHAPGLATAENHKLLDEISQQAAPLIFRFREKKLESLKRDSLESPELPSLIQASREQDIPIVLIKISLEKIAGIITGKNPYLDPFRLQEDLAGVIATLLHDIGSVRPLDPGHLLILVCDPAEIDSRLLLHHLELTVKSFFYELSGEASLDFHAQVKTLHGEEADEIDPLSAFA